MDRTRCPSCDATLKPGEQTCAACGHPLSLDLARGEAPCVACGEEMAPLTATCPACGEAGYPALRPRRGRGWRGAESSARLPPRPEASRPEDEPRSDA